MPSDWSKGGMVACDRLVSGEKKISEQSEPSTDSACCFSFCPTLHKGACSQARGRCPNQMVSVYLDYRSSSTGSSASQDHCVVFLLGKTLYFHDAFFWHECKRDLTLLVENHLNENIF